MTAEKINKNQLRRAAAHEDIFNFGELAKKFNCSREAIYFALERPSRYPIVYAKIEALVARYLAKHKKPEAARV